MDKKDSELKTERTEKEITESEEVKATPLLAPASGIPTLVDTE